MSCATKKMEKMRKKNIYIYMYIYTLLEGMILGNGTKLAVKLRHSIIPIFLLQRAWVPWAQALPKRGPRAQGPVLASSGEIS